MCDWCDGRIFVLSHLFFVVGKSNIYYVDFAARKRSGGAAGEHGLEGM